MTSIDEDTATVREALPKATQMTRVGDLQAAYAALDRLAATAREARWNEAGYEAQILAAQDSAAAAEADRDRLARRVEHLETALVEYGEHASWRCGHPDRYPHFPDCPCGLVKTWGELGFEVVRENDGSSGIVWHRAALSPQPSPEGEATGSAKQKPTEGRG